MVWWVLDEKDQVIRPAILWNDGRTVKQTDYLNNVIGKDKLSEYTANIAFAGFTAPKILWMKEEEPENFAKIKKIMLPKDYLAYRLSGSFCTDYSDASGMLLLDVKNRRWSKEMLEICGITEEQLPKLYESYEVVGTLLPEIAEELGLSTDVKIIAAPETTLPRLWGTGTVGDGQCNISLGTSGTIFISSEKFGVDENNALHSFDHADGKYHLMGCMLGCKLQQVVDGRHSSGYRLVRLPRRKWASSGKSCVLSALSDGRAVAPQRPLCPFCFPGHDHGYHKDGYDPGGAGGRCLRSAGFPEVARSLGISIDRTKICGGGAKSPLWRRIVANVLNLKVDVLAVEEGPALGGDYAGGRGMQRVCLRGGRGSSHRARGGYRGAGDGAGGKI